MLASLAVPGISSSTSSFTLLARPVWGFGASIGGHTVNYLSALGTAEQLASILCCWADLAGSQKWPCSCHPSELVSRLKQVWNSQHALVKNGSELSPGPTPSESSPGEVSGKAEAVQGMEVCPLSARMPGTMAKCPPTCILCRPQQLYVLVVIASPI